MVLNSTERVKKPWKLFLNLFVDATSNCGPTEWLCRVTSDCVTLPNTTYFCDEGNDCGDYSDEDYC